MTTFDKSPLNRMRELDKAWKTGASVECPEDLSRYLKGIVLNDYAHEETSRKLKVILTENAIEYVRERLPHAPEEEDEFLRTLLDSLTKELKWYKKTGGEPMNHLLYEMLLLWGASYYGW